MEDFLESGRLDLYYLPCSSMTTSARNRSIYFLRELPRPLRAPLIVLLDNSSTHKADLIEQLQQQHRRLDIEHFRSYAPELNPDEGVWVQAKQELAHSYPRDVDELMKDILRSIDGIRSSPEKRRACIQQSDLPSLAFQEQISRLRALPIDPAVTAPSADPGKGKSEFADARHRQNGYRRKKYFLYHRRDSQNIRQLQLLTKPQM